MDEHSQDLVTRLHLRQIAILGYTAFKATLVGNPAPFVRRLGERIRNPQIGDLVLESSTTDRLGTGEWDPAALGFLRRIANEPICTREEWDAEQAEEAKFWAERHPDEPFEPEPYEPRYERVYYVDRLSGEGEFRWHNAKFIALPTDLPQRWIGDEQLSNTVTRDSLVSALGDFGFKLKPPAADGGTP